MRNECTAHVISLFIASFWAFICFDWPIRTIFIYFLRNIQFHMDIVTKWTIHKIARGFLIFCPWYGILDILSFRLIYVSAWYFSTQSSIKYLDAICSTFYMKLIYHIFLLLFTKQQFWWAPPFKDDCVLLFCTPYTFCHLLHGHLVPIKK